MLEPCLCWYARYHDHPRGSRHGCEFSDGFSVGEVGKARNIRTVVVELSVDEVYRIRDLFVREKMSCEELGIETEEERPGLDSLLRKLDERTGK